MNINLTLMGQMITFIILIFCTMKFIWPPLQKIMDDRKKKISEGLIFAKNAKKELQSAQVQAKKIIEKAKNNACKVIINTNNKIKSLNEKAIQKTKDDLTYINILSNNQLMIKTNICKINIQKEIVIIAITIAEKLIQNNINEEINNQLLKKLINSYL